MASALKNCFCAAITLGAVSGVLADGTYFDTQSGGWSNANALAFELSFLNTPVPNSGGTLTIFADGDLGRPGASFALSMEGNNLGTFFSSTPALGYETVAFTRNEIAALAEDGHIDVRISPAAASLSGTVSLQLTYGSIPEPATLSLLALAGAFLIRRR